MGKSFARAFILVCLPPLGRNTLGGTICILNRTFEFAKALLNFPGINAGDQTGFDISQVFGFHNGMDELMGRFLMSGILFSLASLGVGGVSHTAKDLLDQSRRVKGGGRRSAITIFTTKNEPKCAPCPD